MNVNFLTKNIEFILLYGPRKAGTTLLQNLIDGAPETLVLPGELKLKYLAENTDQSRLISPNDYLDFGRSLFEKLFSYKNKLAELIFLRNKYWSYC